MTKSIFSFFIVTSLIGCRGIDPNTPELTDTKRLNLTGHVKSLKTYTSRSCGINLDSMSFIQILFDQSGYITHELRINPITQDTIRIDYKRDKLGFLKQKITFDKNSNILSEDTFEYQGRLLKTYRSKGKGSTLEYKYEYYENDSVKSFHYYSNNKLQKHSTFEYNETFSETKIKTHDERGVPEVETIKSMYPAQKCVRLKNIFYDGDPESNKIFGTSEQKIIYDDRYLPISSTIYREDKIDYELKYQYEIDRNKTKFIQQTIRADSIVSCTVYLIDYYE